VVSGLVEVNLNTKDKQMYSKIRMQSLLKDLQSIGQGDTLNKAQALSILNQALPGAIANSSTASVRVLMESYDLTFTDQEWFQVAGRSTQSAGQPLDPNWGNHNSNAQQFARPVSSGGFSVPT
jgi:hypothetical protein